MAYTAWSVVFGEQPSASKWNLLGANDARFESWITNDVRYASGKITPSGTGNLSVTGLAFKPKFVRFSELVGVATSYHKVSSGAMSSSYQYGVTTAGNLSSVARKSTEVACILSTSVTGSTEQVAVFVSFNSDGFTINFTTNSTNTSWAYEAFG